MPRPTLRGSAASRTCRSGSLPVSKYHVSPARPDANSEDTDMLETEHARSTVDLPGLEPWRRGKVRSVYEAGPRHLVIVATDRLSAYDHVLPTPIPHKGRVLTELSIFWFGKLKSAAPHHFVSGDPAHYPAPFSQHAGLLEGRSMLVRRAERIDIECVVRGYLTG